MKFSLVAVAALIFICSSARSATACEAGQRTLSGEYLGTPFEVLATVSAPKTAEEAQAPIFKRSLIIMPPTGGTNYIDRSYAAQFCRAGYQVFILNGWTGNDVKRTDLDIHQEFYSRMLKAVEISLSEIDSPYVGMLGTSVGGLFASVAASKYERLDAVFAIVAGTPLAEVIATSDQAAMVKLAADRRERFGFDTREKHIAAINAALKLEPTLQPPLAKIPKFGMVISDSDTTVPTENQMKLVDFWKPAKLITLGSGHFWSIVRTWLFYDDEILEFFNSP